MCIRDSYRGIQQASRDRDEDRSAPHVPRPARIDGRRTVAGGRSRLHKEDVAYCSVCCNITDVGVDPCSLCADSRREAGRICVVEEPLDVLAIERTGEFRGRYHVLHGAISPIDGIGPERLRTRELFARVDEGDIEEVILATNPNLEGEATAMYLADLLHAHVPSVTRIARGLPVGGDLEYADDVTLIRSLQGRRAMER